MTTPIAPFAAVLACAVTFTAGVAQDADPLPSWNDGKAKQAIIEFVAMATTEGSPDFVPPHRPDRHLRVATFRNLSYPGGGHLLTVAGGGKTVRSAVYRWRQCPPSMREFRF